MKIVLLMPAAHKKEYHNAFPGGYVDMLTSSSLSLKQYTLWEREEGADMTTLLKKN